MGEKHYATWNDLPWGRMLAERHALGDVEKARELLTKAHSTAEANGYGNIERRAVAALRPVGHLTNE